ncbi:hypothetical protein LCGC14_0363100 [marine sediment metagenome]|uniref:Uncharacterized protein n=1 Tax=marine sediment metagenome TaxID=412755 RepID=A0A0F9TD27_9ZZZZ
MAKKLVYSKRRFTTDVGVVSGKRIKETHTKRDPLLSHSKRLGVGEEAMISYPKGSRAPFFIAKRIR